MTFVAVIGAGDIGGAAAHALASLESVNRVLLVDASAGAAAGKALDIQQAGAIAGFHTALEGTDDITRVIGCAVCIVADRFTEGSREWTGDDGLAMLGRLFPMLSRAPIVLAGASQGGLIDTAARELGVPRRRLIGSAPDAFASAARAIVALEAGCSPSEVNLAVLGRPPDGLVIPWSESSIAGHALERRLEQVQILKIESRVGRLWPPGPYALGMAAARVTTAILGSARASYSIMTALEGEFGIRTGVGIVPAALSRTGIAATSAPTLTSRESVKLMSALDAVAARSARP